MKLLFSKVSRVPKWLIYTPEGTEQCAENQKDYARWIRHNTQKTQQTQILVGIGKASRVEKALVWNPDVY